MKSHKITLRVTRRRQLVAEGGGRGGQTFCQLLHMLPMLPTQRKGKQARMGGLLWCRQRPLGGLNSQCYVISPQMGLVRLWAVGGLSTIISQALSVPHNQPLLRAGLSSNPVFVQPSGYFISLSQTNWFFLVH